MPFALLADADLNGTDVGMIVLGVANLLFGFLTVWVKAATDGKIAVLERDLRACGELHAAATADLAQLKAAVAESKEDRAEMRQRLDECEDDRKRLHDENAEQRRAKHDALGEAQALANRVAALELRLAAKPA